jgi:large subunit ribosomal protein L11
MAKKIVKQLKLQIPGGKAVPGQALGPALGQAGINIGEFVKKFNDATKDMMGDIVPTVIRVYEDRSYDMIYKTPPAAYLVKKAIGLETGSGTPNTVKVGKINRAQVKAIAEQKMADLNAKDLAGAMKMIEGTCKSLGVEVVG